uniref:Mediator of RNA polymerase II transcription subunit 11 n=1 Tax=Anthurium amnicola TaxID=1678845 RepID=A0A1D1XHK7_9ARAE
MHLQSIRPRIAIFSLDATGERGATAAAMPGSTQGHNTSLQRLNHVEKMIVRVLDLAGTVMDELAGASGPRKDAIAAYCHEFMQSIRDIQVNLRDEIKSACEYRPFEKCDYNSRIGNEICCKKLEYVIEQLDEMKQNLDQCKDSL